MTIRPGPSIASNVFSLARQPIRGATSPCRILPSAPLMWPIWASSSTAVWGSAVKNSLTEDTASPSLAAFGRLMASRRFREFFGDAELVGAPAHLGPHLVGGDAALPPQHDQMVHQIGALANDPARAVAHRLESDLAGLLHQLLCKLGSTAGEQPRRARIIPLVDPVEVVVEARDLLRVRSKLRAGARGYHL